jgi:hypothetical protein
MKIFITKSFKEKFLKEFKYESILKDFISLLLIKNHNLINLKHPYKKFRYDI